jgi:ribokinase
LRPWQVQTVTAPAIAVVGSINLDLVVPVARFPRPGETMLAGGYGRVPGGKGANQAVAAARLGARVRLVGRVGRDSFAEEAVAGLRAAGVELDIVETDAPTGVAFITVDDKGENQIIVAGGANFELLRLDFDVTDADAVMCQLEMPDDVVREASRQARFFCLNASPARGTGIARDLLVVNELEYRQLERPGGLVALTLGAEGAVLLEDTQEVARARPPEVDVVDTTAAGDSFTACLLVSLLEGRPREEALTRACAAGALAASRPGAQPSLPTAAEVDEILRA